MNGNTNTKVLEQIGLTQNQAKVYLSLLKLGSATAQQIIKESGMHRSPVYDALNRLQEQGLICSVVKDFKQYFQAVSPKKLYSYLQDKKQALDEAMPQLEKIEGMKKEEINASIYKGKEGLKTIHSEMLKEGKNIYVIGGKGLIFSELEYFIPNFEKERIKKKLKWIVLCDKEKTTLHISKRELVEVKTLPKGCDSKSVINIFGNKVATVVWNENYPSAFMIDNKDIADSYRKWFNLLWKKK